MYEEERYTQEKRRNEKGGLKGRYGVKTKRRGET